MRFATKVIVFLRISWFTACSTIRSSADCANAPGAHSNNMRDNAKKRFIRSDFKFLYYTASYNKF